MSQFSHSRRSLLTGLAAGVGFIGFNKWLVGLAEAAGPVRIRHEASSAEGKKMIELYRKAVGLMQHKKQYEPLGWRFQADTHLYPDSEPLEAIFKAGPGDDAAAVARYRLLALGNTAQAGVWGTCTHHILSLPQFLPWHRLFLGYFEKIIEKVVGEPFALPYWGYLDKNNRRLPEAFVPQMIGGQSNPLYFAARTKRFLSEGLVESSITDLSDRKVAALLRNANLLRNPRTNGFSSDLEDLHDQIHGAVGTLAGMGNIAMAARDPIFWLHHASVDRLWESWRQPAGDGSSPRDPDSGTGWYHPEFWFVDADGQRGKATNAKFVLKAVDNLGYRYDGLVAVPPLALAAGPEIGPESPQEIQASSVSANKIKSASDSVTIALKPSVPDGVAAGLSENPSTKYDLVILLTTKPQPGIYQVFLKPYEPGGKEALIGSFSLFSAGGHAATEHATDIPLRIDITHEVQDRIVDPRKPANIVIRPTYLDEPVDITFKGATIVAK